MKNTNKKNRQLDRFHYCLGLETLEWLMYGVRKRPHGMAGAYSNYSYMKKRLKAIIKKMRKRVSDVVTTDEDLKESLIYDFNLLDEYISEIHPKHHNEQEIIGKLFEIIGLLLGWGHNLEGLFERTPIYYQTEAERNFTLHRRSQHRMAKGLLECYERRQIILRLLSERRTYPQVALIMNMTETVVKHLERAEHIDKWYRENLERIRK